MKKILFLVILTILCSCYSRHQGVVSSDCDTVALKYATHISIVKHHDYTVVRLADPWNTGKTLHTYVLVPADKKLPAHLRCKKFLAYKNNPRSNMMQAARH